MKPLLAALAVVLLATAVGAPEAEARRKFGGSDSSSSSSSSTTTGNDAEGSSGWSWNPFRARSRPTVLTITASKAWVFVKADPKAKQLGFLKQGARVKKVGEEKAFYRIETGDKSKGYVLKSTAVLGDVTAAAGK